MSFQGDPFAYYGRSVIEDYHKSIKEQAPVLKDAAGVSSDYYREVTKDEKVGILGAGVGGLYTALIFDSLGIPYEILEASDRTGGRLFTYKFDNGGKYDYYDVGAMRYPLPKKDDSGKYRNGVMKRVAELIEYEKLNQGPEPLRSKVIPYYFETQNPCKPGFLYFNRVRTHVGDAKESFEAAKMGVRPEYIKAGVGPIVYDVVEPFGRMITEDMQTGQKRGWQVMKQNDGYSTRAYMSLKYMPSINLGLAPTHLSTNVINWCEMLDKSSGWYDRGLTETVLESLAFAKAGGKPFGEVEWKCFDGGSQVLTDYMTKYINGADGSKNLIHFNQRVTAIRSSCDLPTPQGVKIRGGLGIAVEGGKERVYSHVISTLPLSVLRTIDMSDIEMTVMQKTALRQLQYGPSIKVGIRFATPWWTTKLGIVGGQSFTDLPVRTIVYPSYGIDSNTPSTVLIASYCWTNDAERMGALINSGSEERLKDIVLRNLAEVHGPEITYAFLKDQYRDMHAWDWNHDPLTIGAFAFFGPGDFQDLYTSLTAPAADNRFHFAGEAMSTRHAWVVGALDSAWRAVYEYLITTNQWDKIPLFKKLWGANLEWTNPTTPTVHMKLDVEKDPRENLILGHLGLVEAAISAGEVTY
ncbi:hypothetical protein HYDPIDRAFT_164579 [Hydnomerulius pinastri MD-312]|nr:hypothetical protein HYDPIDRAFT_164579 [Hydnomerulius pinastri MD-312]